MATRRERTVSRRWLPKLGASRRGGEPDFSTQSEPCTAGACPAKPGGRAWAGPSFPPVNACLRALIRPTAGEKHSPSLEVFGQVPVIEEPCPPWRSALSVTTRSQKVYCRQNAYYSSSIVLTLIRMKRKLRKASEIQGDRSTSSFASCVLPEQPVGNVEAKPGSPARDHGQRSFR